MLTTRPRLVRQDRITDLERTQVADRFGVVLALLVATVFFSVAATDRPWASLVTGLALSATAVIAMWASGAARRVVRAGITIAVLGIGVASFATITGGSLGTRTIAATSLVLTLLTMGAIARRIRVHAEISLMTVLAALCVYVLLGLAFSFTYELLDHLGSEPFFVGHASAIRSDFVYFSYVTLATVGYGDLTAAGGLGRAFAVTEGLMGQIYLVTAVAALVGNLGRRRRGRPLDGSSGQDETPEEPAGREGSPGT
ncbi:MAG: potassium channel family protein [Solirubrobacterales bacterium]|jgi:hypothetical protein